MLPRKVLRHALQAPVEHRRQAVADQLLPSLFTGLYSVTMYALMELRSPASHRVRIIAANNILNALFMIVSSMAAGAMLSAGFTAPQVSPAVALANVVVGLGIFLLVPE